MYSDKSLRDMVCRWQRVRKTVTLGGTFLPWCPILAEREIASGNLLFAREAHYQPLTQLCFSSDEAFLFTGGDDAVVHVWRVMDLTDFNFRSEEVLPMQSWNEHTLGITGIVCGSGAAMTARLYTSSLDRTVKALHFIVETNEDLEHLYTIAVDDNTIPKRGDGIDYGPCRQGYIRRDLVFNNTPIQPHTTGWREIRIRGGRSVTPLARRR